MLKKLYKKIVPLCVSLLLPLSAFAAPGGDLNLTNKASLVSRTGYKLILGNESTNGIDFIQSGSAVLSINSSGNVTLTGTLSGLRLPNNTWFTARNAANSANLNILRATSGDATQLDTASATTGILSHNGTSVLNWNSTGVDIYAGADANRLLSYSSTADNALLLKFGDGGVTATQNLRLTASTADADDDSRLDLSGGGSYADLNRGGFITLFGNENSGGAITIAAGDTATGNVAILTENASTNIQIGDATTTANRVTIANSGSISSPSTIRSTATTNIGWAVVDGTDNTTCESQCTNAAVFGFNLAAGATAPVLVGATDATADICVCAGAS